MEIIAAVSTAGSAPEQQGSITWFLSMRDMTSSDTTIYARVGPHDAVLERDGGDALRLDRQGRWCSMRLGDAFYRRLVDTGVAMSRGPNSRVRPVDDAGAIHEKARCLAEEFARRLRVNRCDLRLVGANPERDRLLNYLEAALSWTDNNWRRQRRLFCDSYAEPILILPPDRYRDVVVQPALGCPSGRCNFCSFYQDRSFRIFTPAEFDGHLGRVGELFGATLPLRDGVFLGSANALAIPQRRLLAVMGQLRDTFGIGKRGVAAFWDPDHSPRRRAEDWRQLADEGMFIVLAGLETGSPRLRATLGKSPDVPRFVERVRTLRRGGMRLGVTVLVGPGGLEAAQEHHRGTTATVERLELGPDDIVYLSPLREDGVMAELGAATAALRRALREKTAAKVVPYHMERFQYFA